MLTRPLGGAITSPISDQVPVFPTYNAFNNENNINITNETNKNNNINNSKKNNNHIFNNNGICNNKNNIIKNNKNSKDKFGTTNFGLESGSTIKKGTPGTRLPEWASTSVLKSFVDVIAENETKLPSGSVSISTASSTPETTIPS